MDMIFSFSKSSSVYGYLYNPDDRRRVAVVNGEALLASLTF